MLTMYPKTKHTV